MKRTSTLVLVCLIVLNSSAQIETCPAGVDPNAIPKFAGVPTLVSGTALQQGAVYKYNNAVTSPFNMYALVTIVDIDKAKVVGIDERDLNNQSNDDRFQPQIAPDNTTLNGDRRGLVTFSMTFYNTSTDLPFPLTGLRFTHYDMDGFTNGTTGWYKEMGCITLESSILTSVNPPTSITNAGNYNQNGYLWKQYMGPAVEHAGTSSDPEVALVGNYLASSSVLFRMGYDFKRGNGNSLSSPAYRQYSAKFGCFSFTNGPLPVKYLSFDAVVNNNAVLLKWITAEEINNSHFEVQRSFDMNNFNTIGLALDGFPANGTGKSYQFKDYSAQLQGSPIVYYRLKQIDMDGKETYSKGLVVRLQAKSDIVMQVSPNPFDENFTARFNAEENGDAQIHVINLTGQTMLSKQSKISKGYNNIQIDGLNRLAPGMYIARLIINGTVIDNQKVIKN